MYSGIDQPPGSRFVFDRGPLTDAETLLTYRFVSTGEMKHIMNNLNMDNLTEEEARCGARAVPCYYTPALASSRHRPLRPSVTRFTTACTASSCAGGSVTDGSE